MNFFKSCPHIHAIKQQLKIIDQQIVNAGLLIMDRYTGGIASQGAASAQVNSQLQSVVNTSVANGVNTKMAFVTVCTAVNTAGSTLLGF